MAAQEIYDMDMRPERPGLILDGWRDIRERIFDEFDRATSEEEHILLLRLFTSTMEIVEAYVANAQPDILDEFRRARRQDYKLLIVDECLVGEDVCTETLDIVTRREIAAGRMAPDASLRKLAEAGMAVPHLSRAELLAHEADAHYAHHYAPHAGRALKRFFSKIRRS